MKSFSKQVGLLFILAMFSGCGSTSTTSDAYLTVLDTSDFTPPTGRPENPPPASAGERRLLTATSTDGIHFTATGKIVTDQGNVPDMIIEDDGTIRLYYIGQSIEAGKKENTVLATSSDNGASWEFKKLTFKNWPQPMDPSDPDVVVLEDGTYRMYYTTNFGKTGKLGIAYADSPDGITFTYKGEALKASMNVVDSSTLFFDDVWYMSVLLAEGDGQMYATSTDGITFTLREDPMIDFPLRAYIASNALITEDEVRMFAFSLPGKNIRSFVTSDMTTWTSSDIALEGDDTATLGSGYIQDLGVAQLADGSYFMVYVSEIPE